jgi:hypothetical protein
MENKVTDKVTTTLIELEPTIDTSQMLEYCTFVQSQMLKVERMLNELM